MTPEQRQSAIDNTRERLEVIVALVTQRPDYPMNLARKAEDIVLAIRAICRKNSINGYEAQEFRRRHAALSRPGYGNRVARGALTELAAEFGITRDFARALVNVQAASECACGCGVPPIMGDYVKGHGNRERRGISTPRLAKTKDYRTVLGKKLHRLKAEKALGKELPKGAEVHHADGTRNDDAPLVICQDRAYHELLHVRMRVLRAGGNPNTDRVCCRCKAVKPLALFVSKSSECKECKRIRNTASRLKAVLARTQEQPKAFPWPANWPRPDFRTDDDTT